MPFAQFPLLPKAEEPMEHDMTPAMEVIQYGDGYTQRYINGINTNAEQYTLRWTDLYQSERNVIYNFVRDIKGDAFLYRLMHEPEAHLFIAPNGISETKRVGERFDMQLVIQRVFDLGHAQPSELDLDDVISVIRGDDLGPMELNYYVLDGTASIQIDVSESNNPAFLEHMEITSADFLSGVAQFTVPAVHMDQVPLGLVSYFRFRVQYYDAGGELFSIRTTEPIGVRVI